MIGGSAFLPNVFVRQECRTSYFALKIQHEKHFVGDTTQHACSELTPMVFRKIFGITEICL